MRIYTALNSLNSLKLNKQGFCESSYLPPSLSPSLPPSLPRFSSVTLLPHARPGEAHDGSASEASSDSGGSAWGSMRSSACCFSCCPDAYTRRCGTLSNPSLSSLSLSSPSPSLSVTPAPRTVAHLCARARQPVISCRCVVCHPIYGGVAFKLELRIVL